MNSRYFILVFMVSVLM